MALRGEYVSGTSPIEIVQLKKKQKKQMDTLKKKLKAKSKTPKPGNKSNAPNPFNNKNKPTSTRRKGPGRPTMTSMVAKPPKPRNKNVTRRPKRPSKQGSFGRQMRASRGMGIIMPSKCCSKVLSRPSTVTKKRTCSSYNKRKK